MHDQKTPASSQSMTISKFLSLGFQKDVPRAGILMNDEQAQRVKAGLRGRAASESVLLQDYVTESL